ncbi:formylglycine-generating enzyme family protein [uncultured Paraglaciecola sp.]|uniref:formylglycine-generating enzyme family protein n=1 Tax=uncultured Paraglaciecola sp. TaxID=1765024 RepID=UPI0030D739D9|tara:strand:- start:73493 stop:74554 length:1062 start_codon:yes stop_codon:yes gene_type:complete
MPKKLMLFSIVILFSTPKVIEAFENSDGLLVASAADKSLTRTLNNTKEQEQQLLLGIQAQQQEELASLQTKNTDRIELKNAQMDLAINTTLRDAQVPLVNAKTVYQIGSTHFKMKNIPMGSFAMGSNEYYSEKPIHRVDVYAFDLMETEVTFAMWDLCVVEGGCNHKPEDGEKVGDKGWGRVNRPVINVSYDDITQQFIPWLNKTTGQTFRLPSEAEWEYAARAGSTRKYHWGDSIDCSKARYGYHSRECGGQKSTDPVKSFSPNAFGLYDMLGNVMEMTQDCWNDSYQGAPTNSKAWLNGNCSRHVARGGSWYPVPFYVRSAYRGNVSSDARMATAGFRLAQYTVDAFDSYD